MPRNRPYVHIIAGHDPSSGAGLSADIKTLEANKVYGLSVCTALTWQHESKLDAVEWISVAKILSALEILVEKYPLQWIKIGIVENIEVLGEIVSWIKGRNPIAQIILDPVFTASVGKAFHEQVEQEKWLHVFSHCHLITPNWEEMQLLFPEDDPIYSARSLGEQVIVYLKGGHNPDDPGRDYLFTGKKEYSFRPKGEHISPKHGSGCVLASAITANLARGYPLHKACLRAKGYTARFLSSHPSLLGYHNR